MRYYDTGNWQDGMRTIGGRQMGKSPGAGPERGQAPGGSPQCWAEFLQQQGPVAAAIGLAAGLASGLIGFGGSLLAMPATAMLVGISQHRPNGAALAVVLAAPVSALSYAVQGAVTWPSASALSIGLVLCAVIGATITSRIPSGQLRRGLALVLVAIASRLLLG